MDDPVWHPTTFTKNRDRLLAGDVAAAFFDAVQAHARAAGLLSDEHFLGCLCVNGSGGVARETGVGVLEANLTDIDDLTARVRCGNRIVVPVIVVKRTTRENASLSRWRAWWDA